MDDFEYEVYKSHKHTTLKYIIAVIACVLITTFFAIILKYGSEIPASDPDDQQASLQDKTSFVVDENTSLADVYDYVVNSVVTIVTNKDNLGSGFIVTDAGHIVTNYHVISGATKVSVVLNNKNKYSAAVVNYDDVNDIAVLKISPNEDLSVAFIGDATKIRTGDAVFAVGTPYSQELYGSLSYGRVCFSERTLAGTSAKYVQTDAPINHGNSGGPLFNMKGEVVGINTYKIVADDTENIGFALSSSTFKPFVESSLSKNPSTRLGIGISGVAVQDTNYSQLLCDGVIVISVTDNGPAEKAGIQSYDIIIGINGTTIKNADDIKSIINQFNDGDKITLSVIRNSTDNVIHIELTLESMEFYE